MKLSVLLFAGLAAMFVPASGAFAGDDHWGRHDRGHHHGRDHGHHHGHNKHHHKKVKVVEHHHYYHDERRYRGPVWVDVVDVEPIRERRSYRDPYQECWSEPVRVVERDEGYDSYTGTIVGGIIGGAIGNELGHNKSNKRVGAAVGAVLGGSIGRDLTTGQQRRSSTSYYRDESRCETRYQMRYDDEVVGYRVYYRYDGEIRETRMDQHPGDRIRINS